MTVNVLCFAALSILGLVLLIGGIIGFLVGFVGFLMGLSGDEGQSQERGCLVVGIGVALTAVGGWLLFELNTQLCTEPLQSGASNVLTSTLAY